jgi:hypothetical protein
VESIDDSGAGCSYPRPVVLDPANPHFTVVDRALMNVTKTSVIAYFGDDSDSEFDSMVEEVGAYSFCWSKIANFTFVDPSRVRVIGRCAFHSCRNLPSIVIPSSVEVIEQRAFGDCYELQEVVFATGSHLRLIEAEVFLHCHFIEPVDVPSSVEIRAHFQVVAQVFDIDGSPRTRVRFYTPEHRL